MRDGLERGTELARRMQSRWDLAVHQRGAFPKARRDRPAVRAAAVRTGHRSPLSADPPMYTCVAVAARGFGDIIAAVFGTTSSSRIIVRRPAARSAWRAATAYASEHDCLVPSELPGYFVDRYAFSMLRWPVSIFR